MVSESRILDAVASARAEERQLVITGASSKRNWLPTVTAEMLTTAEHTGIVHYDASELVVTVRAGTSIAELNAELAKQRQNLAFEAPQFHGGGTVGGMVSSGLSGPSRPWLGSVRDAVLGVKMVNGLAQRLNFGGQVMKNVAGYDVSRLCAGAFGALGVLLEVSIRTRPMTPHQVTLCFALGADAANKFCRNLASQYLPVTGTWWVDEQLFLRLSGTEAGVSATVTTLGGERVRDDALWPKISDHAHDFFKVSSLTTKRGANERLWRLVVPPASPMPDTAANCLAIEWAGGQRWLWHDDAAYVSNYARQCNGWAWALGEKLSLEPVQARYMQAIKQSFDPEGLFVSPLSFTPVDETGLDKGL